MEISVGERGAVRVISLSGSLDASSSGQLEQTFKGLVTPETSRFLLDVEKLQYVSSAGLRVILVMTKTVKPLGGALVLSGANQGIEELIRVTGFSTIVKLAPTLEEALKILE